MREYLPAAEYYEREIALAKGKARPWQTVLYATNRNIDLLWHHLEEEDKRLLMSQWLNDWLTYRASIPRENAERILSLLRSGQLTVRGGVTGIQVDAAKGNFRADRLHPVAKVTPSSAIKRTSRSGFVKR